jgi:hypothetical protein
VFVENVCIERAYSRMTVCGEPLQKMYVQLSMAERSCAQGFGRENRGKAERSSHILRGRKPVVTPRERNFKHLWTDDIQMGLQLILFGEWKGEDWVIWLEIRTSDGLL